MQTSQDYSVQVGNTSVAYKDAGEGRPLLILHGWGSSSNSWTKVQGMIAAKGYRVIVPDLSGFGKTPAPSSAWGVEEYADFVGGFAQKLGVETFVLLGHSFGGQIAVQFAATHPEKLEKLVLVASAAVRRTPGLFQKLVAAAAQAMSFVLYLVPFADLRHNIRSALYMMLRRRDYVRTQGVMRDVFKKVITQDLTAKFSKISMPTLILWGDKDELTPVQDAYLMNELIPNAKLEVIKGGKHALNFQMPEKLAQSICSWLQ